VGLPRVGDRRGPAERQDGGVVLPVVLFDLFMLPPDRIVWTAHLFKTRATPSRRRRDHRDDAGAVEARQEDHLRERRGGPSSCTPVRRSSSWRGRRAAAEASAASASSWTRRSFSTAASMGALLPTCCDDPGPARQLRVERRRRFQRPPAQLRDRGRGGDPSLIYLEWCAERRLRDGADCDHSLEREGCALDDKTICWSSEPRRYARPHHQLYVRQRAALATCRSSSRERLGWWDDPPPAALLSSRSTTGKARRSSGSRPGRRPGERLRVDMTPDRNWTSIGVYSAEASSTSSSTAGSEWLVESARRYGTATASRSRSTRAARRRTRSRR
jgi:hypothetical protein